MIIIILTDIVIQIIVMNKLKYGRYYMYIPVILDVVLVITVTVSNTYI